MKRVILGSLLSCMLVGQAFGGDTKILGFPLASTGSSYQDYARNFGVGFAVTAAPLLLNEFVLTPAIKATVVYTNNIPCKIVKQEYVPQKGHQHKMGFSPDYCDAVPEIYTPGEWLLDERLQDMPVLSNFFKCLKVGAVAAAVGLWGWVACKQQTAEDATRSLSLLAGSTCSLLYLLNKGLYGPALVSLENRNQSKLKF